MGYTQGKSNKILYVLVGCPASGKSYKAKTLKSEGVEYVSRDEIRFSIIKEGEEYFSKERQVFRKFTEQIQSALDSGKSAIADATHINKASRAKLLNALRLKDVIVVAVFCDTPFEVCLQRNTEREGLARVPDDAMYSMLKWSSEPKKEEGFDLIIKLSEEEGI